MRIEKAYAGIEEGQIHLRRRSGAGRAVPLAMLHASPSSSRSLEGLMLAMGEARDLVAFDTPCNGHSCAPRASAPAIAEFADMLSRASCDLRIGRLALYGTHTGAHVAIEWALAEPDRVAGLVLDGVALLDDATRADFLARYAPRRAPDATGSQFHWAWHFIRDQMIFFPHFEKDAAHLRAGGDLDPRLLHDLTLEVLNNLEVYHLPYEAVFRHEVRSALARLDLPVLVLCDGSGALDPASEEVARLVKGARFAHGRDGPAAKAAAIDAFLEDIDAG